MFARKEKAYQKVLSKKQDYMTWTANDLYVVNQLLKFRRNDGSVIPKTKSNGRDKYLSWKDQAIPDYHKMLLGLTATKTEFIDSNSNSNSNNADTIGKLAIIYISDFS